MQSDGLFDDIDQEEDFMRNFAQDKSDDEKSDSQAKSERSEDSFGPIESSKLGQSQQNQTMLVSTNNSSLLMDEQKQEQITIKKPAPVEYVIQSNTLSIQIDAEPK